MPITRVLDPERFTAAGLYAVTFRNVDISMEHGSLGWWIDFLRCRPSGTRKILKMILNRAVEAGILGTEETPTEPNWHDLLASLVRRLEVVHTDPRYQAVWQLHAVHGGQYTEPTYTKEFEAARGALHALLLAPEPVTPLPGGHPESQSDIVETAREKCGDPAATGKHSPGWKQGPLGTAPMTDSWAAAIDRVAELERKLEDERRLNTDLMDNALTFKDFNMLREKLAAREAELAEARKWMAESIEARTK